HSPTNSRNAWSKPLSKGSLPGCGLGLTFRSGLAYVRWTRGKDIQDAAQHFHAFYVERSPEPWQQTASILVAAVDCKGIPMVKAGNSQRSVRLTKGQKSNRKKMATVAAVFTRAPWVRTPEQVVESLFRTDTKKGIETGPLCPPGPGHKRIWASLVQREPA